MVVDDGARCGWPDEKAAQEITENHWLPEALSHDSAGQRRQNGEDQIDD